MIMASSLRFSAALLALILAVHLVLHSTTLAEAAGDGVASSTHRPAGGDGSLTPQECAPRCEYRCSKASRQKRCLFYCNMCCKKCLCVPSGTYGNKEECPCYNNWKNNKGGPKCP